MREMGLSARRGRRRPPRTTDSRHDLPVAPNLLGRRFAAERPDAVWLADLSYLPTDEGWLYLAAIEDLATREIVGWSMADHLRSGLCVDALVMALQRRRPEPGLMHHSDRGGQYAAEPYRRVLERHGIEQSMSRRGNCLDNAPMESFFASLKKEHVTTSASAPAPRPGRRCSSTWRCSTTGSGCTRPWATVPRPKRALTWKGSACARPPDVLIPPLHSPGRGP
jgi:transposase InsO family protein